MQNKLPLNDKNKDKYYIGISNILINNPLFKAKLFEFFDYDIIRLFQADKNDLNEFANCYENISVPKNFLSEIQNIDLNKAYNDVLSSKTKYITYENEMYPEILKNIEDFPLILYYKGSFDNINFKRTIGIVGSRKSTESARQNVFKIVSDFMNTDAVIISGLAEGIDASAHRAAIQNNLKTAAVIGSGLNFQYPSVNKKLYNEIEEKGLILSEYPNDYSPMPQNFPQRNRIVTGLSCGVIIAEAKMKSGAMISARYALEQGRELMCIPGLITNPNCEGIYHLIKNGASVITSGEDVKNLLNWQIDLSQKEQNNLLGIDKEIYETISSEEISIEGLKQKFDIGINELMVKLTEMELSGLIVQKNGLYYIQGK